ncbi:MAG: hypothetical protein IJS99_03495, partial [Synergistaceae bacterium]|nr:hypothetical protein [Synergistaceae bacterium]
MSVKTAEEKLREMLEGEPLKTAKHESRKEAQILDAAKQNKRDKQEAEAFIQDLEKKLPPLKLKPKPVKKAAQQNQENTSQAVSNSNVIAQSESKQQESQPQILPVINNSQTEPEISQIPEIDTSYIDEPDILPVITNDDNNEQENEPEILEPDTSYIDEPEILQDNSINEDLPVIADDNNSSEQEPFFADSDDEPESNPDDLQVIANNESESEQYEQENESEPENLPDIPVIDEQTSEQEDELPVIPVIDNEDENNESEPAPISVTMPESTATAEDKLMADIAEAMTGNPLTLESGNNEPYNLPDFTQDNNNEQQTAEEKLRANIAQAMTESPLDIAQDNINQNLEQDLNPFDELPEFKPQSKPEPFIPDFDENINEPEQDSNNEHESEPESENEQGSEILPEINNESEPEQENEPIEIEDIDLPIQESESEPENLLEINNEPEPEPDFSSFNIDLDDDINQDTPEPESNNESDSESESESESENLPSLLNDPDEHEDNDDFDISSLGALSEAASIIGDDHDHDNDNEHDNTNNFISELDNEPEYTAPESESVIINNSNPNSEEEKSNQQVMSIRDKLKSRKAGDGEGKSWGGLITALLLAALLIVGIMLYFKIGSLANGITIEQAPQSSQAPETYEYAIDFILDQNLTERMTQR